MNRDACTRRRWLGLLGATAAGGAAGCSAPSGQSPGQEGSPTTDSPTITADSPATVGETATTDGTNGTDSEYTQVYEAAGDSVAVVRTTQGQGSCFAYDDAGHFVTNHHVVQGNETVQLHFSGDEWRTGDVLATDVYSDLAVIQVDDPPGYATPLPVVEEEPVVGQEVVVVGTPLGLQGTLTAGVVSGTDRSLETPNGFPIPGAVQTDAAVNPGNSGGPMLSLDTQVIGVVSAGGGENIAFGVPPPLVRRVVPALIEDGEYRHPYLGVQLQEVDPWTADANDLDDPTGVIVSTTVSDGPSENVLRESDSELVDGRSLPVGGDVIVAMDGREITSLAGLSTHLSFETSPGETVSMTVLRDGEQTTVDVELDQRPPP